MDIERRISTASRESMRLLTTIRFAFSMITMANPYSSVVLPGDPCRSKATNRQSGDSPLAVGDGCPTRGIHHFLLDFQRAMCRMDRNQPPLRVAWLDRLQGCRRLSSGGAFVGSG